MIRILKYDQIDIEQWDTLIAISPYVSFFQSRACYEFYISVSFLDAFVIGVEECGQLVGLISGYVIANGGTLKRFFSRRAIVHGGALLSTHISDDALDVLLAHTHKTLAPKAIYIELRNHFDSQYLRDSFRRSRFTYNQHLNYLVDTTSAISVVEKISKSKRRQYRKAIKLGVEVKVSKKMSDMYAFYQLLTDLYRIKVRKPLFEREFFEKIILQPFCKFFVAKYQNKVVAGMICVVDYSNRIIYEWFVCGDQDAYKQLYPSVVITYGAIEYAVNNNFEVFDFMGAGRPDEEYGVRDFKEKFGGELVEYGRFRRINNPLLFKIGDTTIRLFGKLKKNV